MQRSRFMNAGGSRAGWDPRLLLPVLLALGCSDATLGIVPPPPVPAANDLLGIDGSFCTEPATQAVFPVKIMFLIDLSNSMCYSDPASGMCTPLRCDQGPNNPLKNPTPPKRAQAVQDVIDHFQGNSAVSFAVLTFSSSVQAYPYDNTSPHQVFTSDVSQLHLDQLRNVDSITDDAGALSRAETLLSADMADTAARDKSELPRTKYVILFLTDGTPFPKCIAADPSQDDPPDSTTCSMQPSTCTVCQTGGSSSLLPNLMKGMDYNATYQLVQIVNEMHQLADTYQVGELKFNAMLLRVPNAAQCCPGCFADDPTGSIAATLLTALAQPEKDWGTFVEFTSAQDISFLNYDLSSLEEPFAARTLAVENINTVVTAHGLEVDTDGDGLSDAEEFKLGTDPLKADTDGDGYSDLFEVRRGPPFDPLVPQTGRCASHSPKCPNGTFCDTDGDGLTDCEEYELGTDPELVDSDADGLPDGLEFRLGLDPTRDDTHEDLDYDGISNLDEVLDGTSPTERDNKRIEPWSFSLGLTPTGTTPTGQNCYSMTERGLTMPTTLSRQAVQGPPIGWNDTYVWASEAPSGDLRDYGRVRVACVRSRFVPPSVRLPLQPTVTLKDSDFHDPSTFQPNRDCVGAMP